MIEAALAVANGEHVPDDDRGGVRAAARGDGARASSAPTAPSGRRSTSPRRSCSPAARARLFDAVVTDEDDWGVEIQITDPAVVARVDARHVDPGDEIRVRLVDADAGAATVRFERVS